MCIRDRIDDKKTNQRFRADKILEDWISKKNITVEFLSKYEVDNLIPESWGNEKMAEVIRAEIPNNPDTGKPAEWTDARQFNLMLQTQLGVIEDATAKAYLRPETCQSLFTNFKNLTNTTRMRVPFGMAQVGKAFRNEITPGQFLYRTREFEQMEIEYFVENDLEKSKEYFEMWKESVSYTHLDVYKRQSQYLSTDSLPLESSSLKRQDALHDKHAD